jgi:pimeloyl-ACP methyl ester carboxylesterase
MLALTAWMAVRIHRDLRSRAARLMLYAVIALSVVAGVGGAYETFRESSDTATYSMPGQLVDVGGHRLHLNCTGSGSPTVVLEPGAGDMSSAFGWIAPAVARDTRVCTYDRAGRGWSDPANTPQDGRQVATDLHTLLHVANVPGPYVIAGHSFGGLYVLAFAAQYPDEVAGMVLVDSTAPNASVEPSTPTATGSYDVLSRVATLVSISARLGLGRPFAQLAYDTLPSRSGDEVRASIATAANIRSSIDEYVQGNASAMEASSLRDLADKPLVVLTADIGNPADHMAKQDALAALSTTSVHRVVHGASHSSLIMAEEDAVSTTRAILDVVSSVRGNAPLTP